MIFIIGEFCFSSLLSFLFLNLPFEIWNLILGKISTDKSILINEFSNK
jgi:hypothetical protein